jgi:cholinesterase
MSGSVFCKRWSLVPRNFARKYNVALARQLGWNGRARNEKDLLNVLESASPLDLMEAHNKIANDEDIFAYGVLTAFGPVIEPYESSNCLIHKDPVEMARDAWSNDIEFFITANSFEGIVRANAKEELANYYLQDHVNFFPFLELNLDNTDEKAIEYGERIKELYYGEEQPKIENQFQYLQYQSEYLVWHGVYRAVQSRLKYSNKNTYLLHFHVDTAHNFFKFILECGHYEGAGHADELPYLFKMAFQAVPEEDSKEFLAIQRMVGMFTSFATNGSPNCPEIEPTEFHQQTYDPDQLKCIQITEESVDEIDLPELPKLSVWNSIFDDCSVPLY